MSIRRIFKNEEKILKFSNRLMGIIILCATMIFFMLAVKRHEFHININLCLAITLFSLITGILCFISVHKSKTRFLSMILLTIDIGLLGSFQQMNITIFYVIPVFMAYFLQKKKPIYSILILTVIMFNLSKIFKSYNIYIVNPHIFNFKFVLISNMITSLIESFVFLVIALPVYMMVMKQNLDLKRTLIEKTEATNDILQFCSTATSFHNKYLSVHIKGVRDITRIILDALIEEGVYIEKSYYEQIIFSVQFHDIGKIYIDSSILDKKDRLSTSEFDLIKEHPARGLELFSLLPKNILDENYIQTCKNVIYQHHERLDGTGYPTGTKDISFEAKIVAIADVVDALLSWRPYKPPLQWEKVVSILESQKAGFNYECLKIVYQQKDKILAVSNQNNIELKTLLYLMEEDILRY